MLDNWQLSATGSFAGSDALPCARASNLNRKICIYFKRAMRF